MKIIITSKGKEKDSLLDPRFGRCAFFYIYDSKKNKVKVKENAAANVGGGAGIKAANFIIEEEADILITGNLGPNAQMVLKEAGIKVYTSEIKKINEVLKDYEEDKLELFDY